MTILRGVLFLLSRPKHGFLDAFGSVWSLDGFSTRFLLTSQQRRWAKVSILRHCVSVLVLKGEMLFYDFFHFSATANEELTSEKQGRATAAVLVGPEVEA